MSERLSSVITSNHIHWDPLFAESLEGFLQVPISLTLASTYEIRIGFLYRNRIYSAKKKNPTNFNKNHYLKYILVKINYLNIFIYIFCQHCRTVIMLIKMVLKIKLYHYFLQMKNAKELSICVQLMVHVSKPFTVKSEVIFLWTRKSKVHTISMNRFIWKGFN